jgi:GTP-binding protein HflX
MSRVGEENAVYFGNKQRKFWRIKRTSLWSGKTNHITRFPYNKFLYPDYKDAVEKEVDEDNDE